MNPCWQQRYRRSIQSLYIHMFIWVIRVTKIYKKHITYRKNAPFSGNISPHTFLWGEGRGGGVHSQSSCEQVTVSFFMSIHTEQLALYWTNFLENWSLEFLLKLHKFQFWLKLTKTTHFTYMKTCVHAWLLWLRMWPLFLWLPSYAVALPGNFFRVWKWGAAGNGRLDASCSYHFTTHKIV